MDAVDDVLNLEDGQPIPDPLPQHLRVLRVTHSPTKVLPRLPSTIQNVSITHGVLESTGDTDWSSLNQLESLDLSDNRLLTFEIDAPPALAVLQLSFNMIERIDVRVIHERPPLVVLDLTGCRIRELPLFLRPHWDSLTNLQLKFNPLWYTEFSDLPWLRISVEVMHELTDAVTYGVLTTERMRRARYMLRILAQNNEVDPAVAHEWYADIDADIAARDAAEVFENVNDLPEVREVRRMQPEVRRMQRRHAPQSTTHSNPQNVHIPSNQASAMDSLALLQKRRESSNCPDDDILIRDFVEWHTIGTNAQEVSSICGLWRKKLAHHSQPEWINKLLNACKSNVIHSTYHISYRALFCLVLSAAHGHEFRDAIFGVLKDEIIDGESMCFTGRMSRLVNAMGGFIDGVGVHLSTNEELANAIAQIRLKNSSALGEDTDPYLAKMISDVQALLSGTSKSVEECNAWIDAL